VIRSTESCIVGGPAGAILALFLVQQGIDVTLLESHTHLDRDYAVCAHAWSRRGYLGVTAPAPWSSQDQILHRRFRACLQRRILQLEARDRMFVQALGE
jgi:2-polyprenyl-6-methoxyphenol hydroxylase-like FAD-dependent oxidoreductase